MESVMPVESLVDYEILLRHCDEGNTIILTQDGCDKYVLQSAREYEKTLSTIQLLAELVKGIDPMKQADALCVEDAFSQIES